MNDGNVNGPCGLYGLTSDAGLYSGSEKWCVHPSPDEPDEPEGMPGKGKDHRLKWSLNAERCLNGRKSGDNPNPALGGFNTSHLDAGERIVELFKYRPHLIHTGRESEGPAVIVDHSDR